MNSKRFRSLLSLLIASVMILSCFGISSSAADVTLVKKPTKTVFYQGIDWSYNKSNTISIVGGSFDISGTVLSYKSEQVSYAVNKWPNMFSKPEGDSWKVGKNTMRIYCNDFPSDVYASVEVNLVAVESIKIISVPSKTILMQDKDWVLSGLGDVEFTSLDLNGLKIEAKYTDGTTKQISYADNKLIGWAVPVGVDSLEPGEATLYATFCGLRAPFKVIFAAKNAQLPGDVTRDFRINSHDALMVLQHAVGMINLDASHQTQADVDRSGSINSSDALKILQYAVGQVDSLY